jgi:hypothetical protein
MWMCSSLVIIQHSFVLVVLMNLLVFIDWLAINFLLNKHCSKILQETLSNSVSNDSLPLVVRQSRDSFTMLSVKDVMLFQQVIEVLSTRYWQKALWSNLECWVTCFCVYEGATSSKKLKY